MTSKRDNYNNNGNKLFPRYLLIMSENIYRTEQDLSQCNYGYCGEGFSFHFPRTLGFSNYCSNSWC